MVSSSAPASPGCDSPDGSRAHAVARITRAADMHRTLIREAQTHQPAVVWGCGPRILVEFWVGNARGAARYPNSRDLTLRPRVYAQSSAGEPSLPFNHRIVVHCPGHCGPSWISPYHWAGGPQPSRAADLCAREV